MVNNLDKKKQFNRELCEQYPFLIPWNRWSGMLITEQEDGGFFPGSPEAVVPYDYEYTELDDMPDGWRNAFGYQMIEEIRHALIEDGDLDRWRIVQLKEKWARLELYDNGHKRGSKVPDIIEKYGNMSERTCIVCGRKATRLSRGWICPYCDECCPDGGYDLIEDMEEKENGKGKAGSGSAGED